MSEAGSARTSYEREPSRQAAGPGSKQLQRQGTANGHRPPLGKQQRDATGDSGSKPNRLASSSEDHSHSQQPQQQAVDHQMQRKGSSSGAEPVKAGSGGALASGAAGKPRNSQQQQQQARRQDLQHQQQQQQEEPYVVASTNAADLARAKAAVVAASAAPPHPGKPAAPAQHQHQQRTKCFVAGSLWGVNLAPAELQSKQSLAHALAAAFPELPNGVGGAISGREGAGALHIVFVERSGRTYECPAQCPACSSSSSGSGAGEKGWTCKGRDVVRVYVRC